MLSKKNILIGTLALLAIAVGIYTNFFYGKLPVSNPVPRSELNKFPSEYFPSLSLDLKYPKTYSVQDYSKNFKVLTVSKDSERRLEIFLQSDFTDRPEGALAKEKFSLTSKGNIYNIWLFYPEGDEQTKSELHQIYNSVKIK